MYGRTRAWSLVMTRSVSSRPGSSLGYEPEASTTSVAWTRRPPTSNERSGVSFASPRTTSTLRILIRLVRPPTSLSTVFLWNASTPSQSGSPDALIPHSSERFTASITAADWSRALVGMHPRSRHVPPSRSSRSMSATRLPSSAARRAQA